MIRFSCERHRESRMRETEERERKRERKIGSRQRGGEKGKGEGERGKDRWTRFEIFNVHVHASAHSNRAASYGIIIANHDRYLPARIEFDRRKSARGATWFHPAPVHLLLFSLPRGCSIFRPVRRGKRKKKTEKKEEKKVRGGGRAGQGKQEQKTSGLGFSPTEVLHIHEQPALDRLMPKTWNC